MELRREDVSLFEHRNERRAVIAQSNSRIACIERRIGVREIKIRVRRNAFEQPAGPHASKLVPPHVRQASCRRQRGNILGKQAQTFVAGGFIAGRKHGLQARNAFEDENPQAFASLLAVYQGKFHPQNEIERALAGVYKIA